MRSSSFVGALILVLAASAAASEDTSGSRPSAERAGDVERAALARMGFLVGDWEGEGWSLTPSGERSRFWVKEFYHYRGDTDLMDMEGRFGDILADGTRAPEREFGLGFLYFDRASGEYRMWHYSSNGTVFTVPMAVDQDARSMSYTNTSPRGTLYTFALEIGDDGVWVSRIHVQEPDGSWRQVGEFRMSRVGSPS